MLKADTFHVFLDQLRDSLFTEEEDETIDFYTEVDLGQLVNQAPTDIHKGCLDFKQSYKKILREKINYIKEMKGVAPQQKNTLIQEINKITEELQKISDIEYALALNNSISPKDMSSFFASLQKQCEGIPVGDPEFNHACNLMGQMQESIFAMKSPAYQHRMQKSVEKIENIGKKFARVTQEISKMKRKGYQGSTEEVIRRPGEMSRYEVSKNVEKVISGKNITPPNKDKMRIGKAFTRIANLEHTTNNNTDDKEIQKIIDQISLWHVKKFISDEIYKEKMLVLSRLQENQALTTTAFITKNTQMQVKQAIVEDHQTKEIEKKFSKEADDFRIFIGEILSTLTHSLSNTKNKSMSYGDGSFIVKILRPFLYWMKESCVAQDTGEFIYPVSTGDLIEMYKLCVEDRNDMRISFLDSLPKSHQIINHKDVLRVIQLGVQELVQKPIYANRSKSENSKPLRRLNEELENLITACIHI